VQVGDETLITVGGAASSARNEEMHHKLSGSVTSRIWGVIGSSV
jgi:hypothetical protein